MLATTINRTQWSDEFREYTRGIYSLEACWSIFDDLISWQERIGEDWVKNLTYYDVRMIYTEYKTLEEFIEDYQLKGVKTIEEINNLDSMVRDFKEVLPVDGHFEWQSNADTGRVLVSDFSNHWKNY
tara:strand:- start:1713 stop:2093 length:381 start_codon:yes stop_codon:yes gene_type:complete